MARALRSVGHEVSGPVARGFDPATVGLDVDALILAIVTVGAAAVAGLGSPRVTNEESFLFQKFLRVAVNGRAPDIQRVVRDFPPQREESEQGTLVRGLEVRLSLRRQAEDMEVGVDLKLDERALFYPTDAALATWIAQADRGQAVIVYE